GLADRVVVLRDGRNAGALARQEISHDRIVKLMVGRELNRSYHRTSNRQRNPAFEVRGLRTRRYPAHTVSFEVGRGEIVGLAGLVGAGRSELAQAIFGVEKALEGTFLLEGKPIRLGAPGRAIEHGIYLVPEDRRRTGLVMGLAIRENITLPALPNYSYAGLVNRNAERAVASDFCARLNIKTSSIEVRVENLSGGTQQKVVLARWMSLNPKVLIFDEPTRGIDVGAKAEIYQLIRGLADSGVGIIMISSDMEEILGESDRIAVMHEGAISGILERHEANEEAIMRLLVGQQLGGGNEQPCEGDSPTSSY
ncbi:MAG: sugar ABC transporter ATP-binding protein, partial [Blastocatellia bacterium]